MIFSAGAGRRFLGDRWFQSSRFGSCRLGDNRLGSDRFSRVRFGGSGFDNVFAFGGSHHRFGRFQFGDGLGSNGFGGDGF